MHDAKLLTPKEEIDRRIAALQSELVRMDIDAALILQKVDLYYYAGTLQQGCLVVPAAGAPRLLAGKSSERARAESPLEQVIPLPGPKAVPGLLRQAGLPPLARIGLELDVLPANLYFIYRDMFPGAEVVDISTPVRHLRSVKSEYELGIIREAAACSDRLAAAVPGLMREGMTEIELAGKIEAEARRMGHQGIVRMRLWGSEMFFGHLLSGPSGAVPSYLASPTGGSGVSPAVAQSASFRTLRRHEPVLVDYVFAWRGYVSDMTRIFSIGRLPEDLAEAHRAMLALQAAVMPAARPGVASGALYDFSLEFAREKGYDEYFMGVGPERIRFVGHGVGLELDEFPFLNAGQNLALKENMVIALEPKLIFPGRGVVGIENIHRVTADGLERLGRYTDEITVV
jgi:Xaa-Pro aminopeptidase